MPTNYDNCVCQVKAKTGNGDPIKKGFCDVQKIAIPVYLCVTDAFFGGRRKNDVTPSWQFRLNTYTGTGSEKQLDTVYNAIPKNTQTFCSEYFRRFHKYPEFELFLYGVNGGEEQLDNENDITRAYLNPDAFINAPLSSTYYRASSYTAKFSNLFLSFLKSEATEQTFRLKYGMPVEGTESEKELEFDSSYVDLGEASVNLAFKVGDNVQSRIHDFNNDVDVCEQGDTNKKWFTMKFNKDTEGKKVESLTLTKESGEEAPTYKTAVSCEFAFYYKIYDHAAIDTVMANDDIIIWTEPKLKKEGAMYFVDYFERQYASPNIMFSYEGEDIVETRAMIGVVTQKIREKSTQTNESEDNYDTFTINLHGDAVCYEGRQNGKRNDSSEDEDIRNLEDPLFYLDEDLNLPEFWNVTDETTL